MVKIGIIGGSGLDNPDILKDAKEITVITPYGPPTSSLTCGAIEGVDVVIIARHGKDHSIYPSAVNFRANIWALKEQGCTHILASTAVGSLREELAPGHLVFPSQFIDHTRKREVTFFNEKEVVHTSMAEPFCLNLIDLLSSSAKEMELFSAGKVADKNITAEVCVHHLWFDERDYINLGTRIKWNPSIKTVKDKEALWEALLSDKIDVIATDHAPHTLDEKNNTYFNAPSGGPLVQHSLVAMLEMSKKGFIRIEKVIQKMCHAPADLFRIEKRGYIREGYFADLVLVDPNKSWTVSPENILYKCAWSPFEGTEFSHKIVSTFINGEQIFKKNRITEDISGARITFNK